MALLNVVTTSVDYPLTTANQALEVNAVSGARLVPLPDASVAGQLYTVKKIDASPNPVTLLPIGGQTVDGATRLRINDENGSVTVKSAGGNWRIASVFRVPRDPYVNLYDVTFGINGDGSDDSAGWLLATAATIKDQRTLKVAPQRSAWHSIRQEIPLVPFSGTSHSFAVECEQRDTAIRYEGPNGTPGGAKRAIFRTLGWNNGKCELGAIQIVTKNDIVAFDLDATSVYPSTGQNDFNQTEIRILSGSANCVGYRLGHSATGQNITTYCWNSAQVKSDALGGHIGWINEGANSLPHFLNPGAGGYNLTKLFSNNVTPGAASGQGSSSWHFIGCLASFNAQDFDFRTPGHYVIIGGDWELGQRFIGAAGSALQPYTITLQGAVLRGYAPSDGRVIYCGPNGSFLVEVDGNHIYDGIGSGYGANLITLHSTSASLCALSGRSNLIEGADPPYQFIGGVRECVNWGPNQRLDSTNSAWVWLRSRHDRAQGGVISTDRVGYGSPNGQGFYDDKSSRYGQFDGAAASCSWIKETTGAVDTGWVAK